MTTIDANRQDSIVRIASPDLAAEKLGWTIERVTAHRAKLGLPEFTWAERRNRKGPARKKTAKG